MSLLRRTRNVTMAVLILLLVGMAIMETSYTGEDRPSVNSNADDLPAIARSNGVSLEEAEYLYGWQDEASGIISSIKEVYPDSYTTSDMRNRQLKVGFSGEVAADVQEMLDAFNEAQGVPITATKNMGFNSGDIDEALLKVHRAVMAFPGVVNALTVSGQGQLESEVIYRGDDQGSPSVLSAIQARAETALVGYSGMSVTIKYWQGEGDEVIKPQSYSNRLGGVHTIHTVIDPNHVPPYSIEDSDVYITVYE